MTNAPREPRARVLRGISTKDEQRPAGEVLAAIPWDRTTRRETLPAEAFLAAIRG